MKKFKGIVLVMFCCLFTGVGILSACSADEETTYSTMLDSIAVNASGAKTSYALGEEFSSDGLIVTAETSINNVAQSTITVTDYTVDSSNFDNTVIGTYTIYVSYALETNTAAIQHAEYNVTVTSSLPEYANLKIEYSGDQQLAYSTSGVTIDLSSEKLTVNSYVGNDSANLTETAVTDYTLYYSVNSGELTQVSGSSVTATEAGTYSFYAVKTYTSGTETLQMRGQFVVYVVDEAVSIAKDEGGTTSYEFGADKIGSDWTYTVTYTSGATKTFSYDDVEIKASSNSGDQTATVTYTQYYVGIESGEVSTIKKTLTTTVSYTVAAASLGDAVVYKTPALSSVDDFEAVEYSAGTEITSNDLFTLESTLSTTTSIGKDSGNNLLLQVVKSGNTFSYTDLSGTTVAPDQGIKLSSAIKASEDSGTAFTLTANSYCVVEVYMTFANDSYNSNRAGTIYYAIDGEQSDTTYSVSARTTVVTLNVTLKAGQVLTIGAVNNATSDAKLWLFGASAQPVT